MKKLLFSLIATCCIALPAVAQQDTVVEEIVARVNNTIITRADLRHNQEQAAQEARENNVPQKVVDEREANSLRDLIDQQLLLQKAADLGISADADLVKRLDDLRKEMKASSMEELQKQAESQGVSWEEFKQNTKNGILTSKVVGAEVGSHIQVTREEMQKFYEEHKADISQPERVRLSEILIANDPNAPKPEPGKESKLSEPTAEQVAAAEAKANEIYRQLQSGAKFDELARKESNGTTAEQGGDLGYFKHGDLAKELEDKTFGIKVGEFTPPIRTRQGFVILRVNDHIEAGVPPFERVRDQVQEQLYGQKIQPALREYLTKLREDAYIDIKPGYTDTGASPNQTKLVYTSDTGPKTKQVRTKMGIGKKKTVVVVDKPGKVSAGSNSGIGLAKAEVDAKAKAEQERQAKIATEKAKAAEEAAEKEKLSHMTPKEQRRYLADKQKREKQEAKSESKEVRKQKKLDAEAKHKADLAAKGKGGKDESAQNDPSLPPKKKKISWF